MAVGTDLWELILDLKHRFDALGTPSQFVALSFASLFCSFIYGYLLDGWINEDVVDNYTVIAQSENLFAMLAAITHTLCAGCERILRDAFTQQLLHDQQQAHKANDDVLNSNDSDDEELGLLSMIRKDKEKDSGSNSKQPPPWNIFDSIFYRDASLRSYMLYSTLESLGILCLNWSLLYVDKHVCAIFKSNKIILILIGEVFFLKTKEDISGFEVASILGVAVSMMLLSLSELDELYHFDLSGIPLILFGILASASAPILAKQYIFTKYSPQRTEVLFFHKFFTAIFLFMGVLPQFIQLFFYEDWFNQHLLGFAEMLMLSIVSYFSLSLMMIIIDIFGPTNSELVECTSLVTSVLFSYYFIEAGSEFVAVHMLAMIVFVISFGLNVKNLSEQQSQIDKLIEKKEIQILQSELHRIITSSTTLNKSKDIKKRTDATTGDIDTADDKKKHVFN
eukprot:CAMPEP_0197036046 /NCGR_PEP_ID=MMETSP1384-20130603/13664_1 /TAXON_ID=29189 /ORGANISM="Ammonia sp." /LENGTH=450 /DNA_ID=CAMNT_0042466173 /DNA_START=20 /DNA_END=1372 /DNA_ORIENTATION=+